MGNAFVIGTDLALDVAVTIYDKIDSKINLKPVDKYEAEIKNVKSASSLFVKWIENPFEIYEKQFIKQRNSPYLIRTTQKLDDFLIQIYNSITFESFEIQLVSYCFMNGTQLKYFPEHNRIYFFDTTLAQQDVVCFVIGSACTGTKDTFTGLRKKMPKPVKTYLASEITGPHINDLTPVRMFKYEESLYFTGSNLQMKCFDFETGKLNQDFDDTERDGVYEDLEFTMHGDYVYSLERGWCYASQLMNKIQIGASVTWNDTPDFHCVSPNGEYVLLVNCKSVFRLYQASAIRSNTSQQLNKYLVEFSVLGDVRTVDFSYDSNFIVLTTSEYQRPGQLMIYSIEKKYFVLSIESEYMDFQSHENLIYLGNLIDNQNSLLPGGLNLVVHKILETRLPSMKIYSVPLSSFTNMNFRFK